VKSRRAGGQDSALTPLGLECALPSRELRLAQTPAPVRASLWKRACTWLRTGLRRGPAAV
jgi:hypothetical protein